MNKSNDYLQDIHDIMGSEVIKWREMRYLILVIDEYEVEAHICRLKSTAIKEKNRCLSEMKVTLKETINEFDDIDGYSHYETFEQLLNSFRDFKVKIIPIDFSNPMCNVTLDDELKKLKKERNKK